MHSTVPLAAVAHMTLSAGVEDALRELYQLAPAGIAVTTAGRLLAKSTAIHTNSNSSHFLGRSARGD